MRPAGHVIDLQRPIGMKYPLPEAVTVDHSERAVARPERQAVDADHELQRGNPPA
jgi:hypothetical protein